MRTPRRWQARSRFELIDFPDSNPYPLIEATLPDRARHASDVGPEMKKLAPGDRIHLGGGYDYDPKWLKGGHGYDATVLRYFDNGIEGRSGDEKLSIVIKFDESIKFDGVQGEYGVMLGRWQDQQWTPKGVSHIHLTDRDVASAEEFAASESVWMESHASYDTIGSQQAGDGKPDPVSS